MAKKDPEVETVDPAAEVKDQDSEAKAAAMEMHDGMTQTVVDTEGEQFVRKADTEMLRPENMATQAQVQYSFKSTPLNAKPEEGKVSLSVDGQSSKVCFPMLALTHVTVGDNAYGPGQPFDAMSNENRESLIAQKAAVDRQLKLSEDMRVGEPTRTAQTTNMTI